VPLDERRGPAPDYPDRLSQHVRSLSALPRSGSLPPGAVAEGNSCDPIVRGAPRWELVAGRVQYVSISSWHPAELREGEVEKVGLAGAHEVLLDRVGQEEKRRVRGRLRLAVAFCK